MRFMGLLLCLAQRFLDGLDSAPVITSFVTVEPSILSDSENLFFVGIEIPCRIACRFV